MYVVYLKYFVEPVYIAHPEILIPTLGSVNTDRFHCIDLVNNR